MPETTLENLYVALTQIKKNQVPGKGNFAIAGLPSCVFGRHNRLAEVKKGNQNQLKEKQDLFVYEVFLKIDHRANRCRCSK